MLGSLVPAEWLPATKSKVKKGPNTHSTSGNNTCSIDVRQENWIKTVSAKHNNIYSYKNVVYSNIHQHVSVTCPQHGDFSIRPSNHLRGAGCPKCKEILEMEELAHTINDAKDSVSMNIILHDIHIRGATMSKSAVEVYCKHHKAHSFIPYKDFTKGIECGFCNALEMEPNKVYVSIIQTRPGFYHIDYTDNPGSVLIDLREKGPYRHAFVSMILKMTDSGIAKMLSDYLTERWCGQSCPEKSYKSQLRAETNSVPVVEEWINNLLDERGDKKKLIDLRILEKP